MITKEPTEAMVKEWKSIWLQYKDKLTPNRKTGKELLDYLQQNYVLTEIQEKNVTEMIIDNIIMNIYYAEKLLAGTQPLPRAFYLENKGSGEKFYQPENKDENDVWGDEITRIFVGIDIASGFFMVEGSCMLYDELYVFLGLDEMDINNFVCVAEYINTLKRFNLLQDVVSE